MAFAGLLLRHQLKERPAQTKAGFKATGWSRGARARFYLRNLRIYLFGELGAFLVQVRLFGFEGSDPGSDLRPSKRSKLIPDRERLSKKT